MKNIKKTFACLGAMSLLASGSITAASAIPTEPAEEAVHAVAAAGYQNPTKQINLATKINWGSSLSGYELTGLRQKLNGNWLTFSAGTTYYNRVLHANSFDVRSAWFGFNIKHKNWKNPQSVSINFSVNAQGLLETYMSVTGAGQAKTQTVKITSGKATTITLSQADRNKIKNALGVTINSYQVTPTVSAYRAAAPTVCWTPSSSLASDIDLSKSKGIAKIGSTYVLPYSVAGWAGFSPTADIYLKSTGKKEKLDVGSYFYDHDLAVMYPVIGSHPPIVRIADISTIVPYDGDGGFSKGWPTFRGIVKMESAWFETKLFGTIDVGCTRTPTLAARGLESLDANGKFITAARFTDVGVSDQFFKEINWLASTGITTGYSDGTFRRWNTVERGAMAAFFYRMAGSPSYTPPKVSKFKDVPTTHQFYKEISWMASKGITTGYADGTFKPSAAVNRDAMAAFFYRFAGKPAYTAPKISAFKDVSANRQFYKEISWLASKKVSSGWSVAGGSEFRPGQAINRDAMAAFIYRYNSNVARVGKK